VTPLNKVVSHVIPLLEDNIDTDQLLPKQFLTEISRAGFGKHLLHDRRYLDQHESVPNPDCVLNQKAYKTASILITGKNFGCGSSREHAPWALADFGISVIIGKGFADIFYANCLNNQILPIVLPDEVVNALALRAQRTPGAEVTVDLSLQTVSFDSSVITFSIPEHHRANLLNGVDKIGRTLQEHDRIKAYEVQNRI
jgi:3-isopropylmalate/(R)-2-methylmalate dehydratase small subunit